MFAREFENNRILQWSLGALILGYFIVFSEWINGTGVSRLALETNRYLCPPYLQNCEWAHFLNPLPYAYSQTVLYMGIFAILAWCIYLMSERAWKTTQLCLIPIFLWHTANVFIFSDFHSGNYEYYLVIFGATLLFLPHKEFFLKFFLVQFYVLSTFSKIHPSWIEGSYFSALRTGLPFFPDWSIPIWTNVVILAEMFGAWFLLSRNLTLQRYVFAFFVIFHLYSGILVEYRYPATVLPFLLIAFGPWYRFTPVPLDKQSIAGWLIVFSLFTLQITPKLIEGDEKLTLEGNKYGLYMFDANHQCFSETTIVFDDGSQRESTKTSITARRRCQPYEYWFPLKKLCERNDSIARIEWRFNHSINGGPFYQIVHTTNACDLSFDPFGHNDWIQTEETADIVGYPVRNVYY